MSGNEPGGRQEGLPLLVLHEVYEEFDRHARAVLSEIFLFVYKGRPVTVAPARFHVGYSGPSGGVSVLAQSMDHSYFSPV